MTLFLSLGTWDNKYFTLELLIMLLQKKSSTFMTMMIKRNNSSSCSSTVVMGRAEVGPGRVGGLRIPQNHVCEEMISPTLAWVRGGSSGVRKRVGKVTKQSVLSPRTAVGRASLEFWKPCVFTLHLLPCHLCGQIGGEAGRGLSH